MESKGISNISVKIKDKDYEGYSVDLIYEISRIRNFTYTFELVPDGNYGSYNDVNKSWDGLIKRLLDHVRITPKHSYINQTNERSCDINKFILL